MFAKIIFSRKKKIGNKENLPQKKYWQKKIAKKDLCQQKISQKNGCQKKIAKRDFL